MTQKRYGCHNRPQLKTSMFAQVGYRHEKHILDNGCARTVMVPVFRQIRTNWKDGCNYDQKAIDPRCLNCHHQEKDHAHS